MPSGPVNVDGHNKTLFTLFAFSVNVLKKSKSWSAVELITKSEI